MTEDIEIRVTLDKKSVKMTEEEKQRRAERLEQRRRKKEQRRIEKRRRGIDSGVGTVAGAASNPLGAAGGFLGSVASRIPHFAIVLIAVEVLKQIRDQVFSPGGPFDRRLRIEVDKQINAARSRELARQIAVGNKVIRVSASPGITGREGLVGGNLYELSQGRQIDVDLDTQFSTKGIG